ncbi:MAG: hypothetical protein ACXW28_13820 [Thermoanaerobaculia bacterium]
MLALVLPVLAVLAFSIGLPIPLSTPVIKPAPFVNTSPDVASNGSDFLVVWTTGSWGGEVRGARVDRNGAVLDAGVAVARWGDRGQGLGRVGRTRLSGCV